MAIRPYLSFPGNCREAFTRYEEIFGGELVLLGFGDVPADAGGAPPGASPDAVMHGALTAPVGLLLGADAVGSDFDGQVRGMCVNAELETDAEAKRVFDALAEGGEVQMPIGPTFFASSFGMCIDRFGTPWMVMGPAPTA